MEPTKAYIKAYEKNNYSFSPPQARRVSIADEEALKKIKNPALGQYNVERGLKVMSRLPKNSITSRRRS